LLRKRGFVPEKLLLLKNSKDILFDDYLFFLIGFYQWFSKSSSGVAYFFFLLENLENTIPCGVYEYWLKNSTKHGIGTEYLSYRKTQKDRRYAH